MRRLKRVLGWLCGGLAAVALGTVIWNLPQGKHTEVVPMGEGDGVAIGRAEPGFDKAAEARATTIEDLRKVRGLHLQESQP